MRARADFVSEGTDLGGVCMNALVIVYSYLGVRGAALGGRLLLQVAGFDPPAAPLGVRVGN